MSSRDRDLARLLELLAEIEALATSRKIHALRAEYRAAVRLVVRVMTEGGHR
jgi:hypothetical protein